MLLLRMFLKLKYLVKKIPKKKAANANEALKANSPNCQEKAATNVNARLLLQMLKLLLE